MLKIIFLTEQVLIENKININAVIPNNTPNPAAGEVIFGNQTMGIKGYFATVTMTTDDTTNNGGLKALFAVSSEFIMK